MDIKAYAKINLTLDVTGIRENGYHDLYTVFQPISLCDTLTIEQDEGEDIVFTCTDPCLLGRNNLVIRAYHAMRAKYPRIGGVRIHLDKQIPSCAGLGGGSADAAAVIRGLDQLFSLGLSMEEMLSIGAPLGADVPAQILLRAAVGEGIGDRLTPVGSSFAFPVVIYQPDSMHRTDEMYRRLDEVLGVPDGLAPSAAEQTRLVVEGLQERSLEKLIAGAHNVFEQAVPDPAAFAAAREMILSCGFDAAVMSGSGSAMFCLAADDKKREAAAEALAERISPSDRLFLCEAIDLTGAADV